MCVEAWPCRHLQVRAIGDIIIDILIQSDVADREMRGISRSLDLFIAGRAWFQSMNFPEQPAPYSRK
jgi:hypothetical protein